MQTSLHFPVHKVLSPPDANSRAIHSPVTTRIAHQTEPALRHHKVVILFLKERAVHPVMASGIASRAQQVVGIHGKGKTTNYNLLVTQAEAS